ncbi:hypothetical protein F4780DRAFT_560291 [Xylariomycetidae sp. FL0641]|nr:hypothetical protein F4780DRAFT_560291 [Xylariomycetidae sp. FL0641]
MFTHSLGAQHCYRLHRSRRLDLEHVDMYREGPRGHAVARTERHEERQEETENVEGRDGMWRPRQARTGFRVLCRRGRQGRESGTRSSAIHAIPVYGVIFVRTLYSPCQSAVVSPAPGVPFSPSSVLGVISRQDSRLKAVVLDGVDGLDQPGSQGPGWDKGGRIVARGETGSIEAPKALASLPFHSASCCASKSILTAPRKYELICGCFKISSRASPFLIPDLVRAGAARISQASADRPTCRENARLRNSLQHHVGRVAPLSYSMARRIELTSTS